MSTRNGHKNTSIVGVDGPEPMMVGSILFVGALVVLGILAYILTGRGDSLVGMIVPVALLIVPVTFFAAIYAAIKKEVLAALILLIIAVAFLILFFVVGIIDPSQIVNNSPWEVRP